MLRSLKFLSSRILQMLPVVFLASVILFAITFLLPGDPTFIILGEFASDAQREAARIQYGLNDPLPVQYLRWLGRTLSGDLGRSLLRHEHVSDMLARRFPITLELCLLSILVAIAIGVPSGIVAARWRGRWVDILVSLLAMTSVAMPYFWAAILLILFFSLHLGWLPSSGFVPFSEDPIGNLKLMVLPTLTIGTSFAGLIMRQVRSAMLQVLSQDYIRTARAKGLTERRVFLHHAFRSALVPVVTVIGLQIGSLLGGAVVVETVFSIPGLGRMMMDSIYARDYPAIQGAVLLSVLCVLLVTLIVDIVYTLVDPRIDY